MALPEFQVEAEDIPVLAGLAGVGAEPLLHPLLVFLKTSGSSSQWLPCQVDISLHCWMFIAV